MAELHLQSQLTPQLPQPNKIKLFVDSIDNHLKQIDSNGIIIDLTETALNIRFLMINNTGSLLSKGSAVKFDSFDNINNEEEMVLAKADAPGNMPAIGLLETDTLSGFTGFVTFQGNVIGLNTSSFNEGDQLYVSKTPGILTNNRPTGGDTLIQLIGSVGRTDATLGTIVVHGALRSNALPNLNPTKIWVGGNNGIPQQVGGPPINQRVINSLSDFPTAVGGVFTLEDNCNYVIAVNIITSNRFILGTNSSITANNLFSPVFTYTGTDTMLTIIDTNFSITRITIDCPNGVFIDHSSTSSPGNSLAIQEVRVLNCFKIGTLDDLFAALIINSIILNTTEGLTIKGVNNWALFSTAIFSILSSVSTSLIAIDLTTSIHEKIQSIDFIVRGIAGSIGLKGLPNDGNLKLGTLGTVVGGEFSGGLTPLSGVNISDIRWEFKNNIGLANSFKSAEAFLTIPEQVTNPGIGIFTLIGSINWQDSVSDRFTISSDGIITYISEIDSTFKIDGTATLQKVGGGADQLVLRVAKNGTTEIKTQSVTQNATPTSVYSKGIFNLTLGDTIDLRVSNFSSGVNDIIVSNSNLTALEL